MVERRVQARLGEREVEHVGDLGLADRAGALVEHPEGDPQADRRDGAVVLAGRQGLEELEGEAALVGGHRGELLRGQIRREVRGLSEPTGSPGGSVASPVVSVVGSLVVPWVLVAPSVSLLHPRFAGVCPGACGSAQKQGQSG